MSKTRVSALDRLKELPEVFTLNTVASVLECTTGMASTYIGRWREQGLTQSLGPRAGVHFNLLRNPSAADDMKMEAIGLLFPGALVGGVSAIHAAGWTTQFPRQVEIMIPQRRSFPAVDETEITGRPLKWIKEARKWISQPGPVPYLNPAFALADCLEQKIWVPDPDDIEWDEVNVDDLRRAFEHFGIEIPEDWAEELEYVTRAPLMPSP
jgi:hypothetical protein